MASETFQGFLAKSMGRGSLVARLLDSRRVTARLREANADGCLPAVQIPACPVKGRYDTISRDLRDSG